MPQVRFELTKSLSSEPSAFTSLTTGAKIEFDLAVATMIPTSRGILAFYTFINYAKTLVPDEGLEPSRLRNGI